ncbi:hypothetical protein RFI_04748 [Reticulomyxa filosa]|uniref:Uncharacterized protein n=1 Tax=Reticulomyxa filosa TaxID=46433 RepID=X6P473_RETFI|nr:hypothetical protein RFI_04748 [Reticulomyxa filosa]|eukprot:ETO32372.1 hypothetical protein RFI_04748 [Reticulomyxa filosa]
MYDMNLSKASQKVVWLSWAICNDVMYDSMIVLTYKAHEIAVAAIRVASELIQQITPDELKHFSCERKHKNVKDQHQTSTHAGACTAPTYIHEYEYAVGTTVGTTVTNRNSNHGSKKIHQIVCGTLLPQWWKKFDISESTLNEICSKILDMYESPASVFESANIIKSTDFKKEEEGPI